jgi:transposase-like protein
MFVPPRYSHVGVGRKYGVSDNAIRKWRIAYERQREREAAGGSLGEPGAARAA